MRLWYPAQVWALLHSWCGRIAADLGKRLAPDVSGEAQVLRGFPVLLWRPHLFDISVKLSEDRLLFLPLLEDVRSYAAFGRVSFSHVIDKMETPVFGDSVLAWAPSFNSAGWVGLRMMLYGMDQLPWTLEVSYGLSVHPDPDKADAWAEHLAAHQARIDAGAGQGVAETPVLFEPPLQEPAP